jgi:hypothetical protein
MPIKDTDVLKVFQSVMGLSPRDYRRRFAAA